MGTCTKGGKQTDSTAFATYRHRDGRIGRRNICLECRAVYHLENYDRLKQYRKEYNKKNRTKKSDKVRRAARAFVDKIKEEASCSDCGKYFPAVAVGFDHLGPKTKGVSAMVSQGYSTRLILEEINKCELVCACCHRVRTKNRKDNLAPRKKKI